MALYEIIVFETEDGKLPFQQWFDAIKDQTAKTLVTARLSRAAAGNFGDWKPLKGKGTAGLCEMRIQHGAGYRIYYTIVGREIVLLLAGSTNRDQDRVIVKAKAYLAEANRRNEQ